MNTREGSVCEEKCCILEKTIKSDARTEEAQKHEDSILTVAAEQKKNWFHNKAF